MLSRYFPPFGGQNKAADPAPEKIVKFFPENGPDGT